MATEFSRATILPKFYDRIAGTIAGTETPMVITSFKFGHGYIDETTNPPTFLQVPDTITAIPAAFYTGTTECLAADGRVLVRCHMPVGGVSTPKKMSMAGFYDGQGNLIAVLQSLPDWLTPTDDHIAFGYLDFPNLGDNPPTASYDLGNV